MSTPIPQGSPHRQDYSSLREWLYSKRDRIAYAFFLRKELARKVVFASAVGLSLVLSSPEFKIQRNLGPEAAWRIDFPDAIFVGLFLGVLSTLIGLTSRLWGAMFFLVSLLGMVVLYAPEIAGLALTLILLTGFVLIWVRPRGGAMAALVILPFLENWLNLGFVAPLGFACFYSFGNAFLLTVLAFLWTGGLGLLAGSIPRYAYVDSSLFPFDKVVNLTALAKVPWNPDILAANKQAFMNFYETLFWTGYLWQPFVIHTALAILVIWVVRSRHKPVKYQDRLALEYLSRGGENVATDNLSLDKIPLACLLGLVIWTFGQWLLAMLSLGDYSLMLFLGDLLSSLAVIPLLLLDYHGDPIMPQEFSHGSAGVTRKDSTPPPPTYRIKTPSEMRLPLPSQVILPSRRRESSRMRIKDPHEAEPAPVLPPASAKPLTPDREPTPQIILPTTGDQFEVGGKIDGQYRVEQIHMGGMAIVYIVTDDFSEVRFAVKTLRSDLRNNEEAVARFITEAKTWIRLGHHPNIVQAMYFREVQGRPLLFLEYVDGTDLEEVFSRPGPGPSIEKLVNWGMQFCEGMQFANTKDLGGGVIGLVHRDIKPGNIMLTRDETIKITDFGLAKVADAPTSMTREKVGLGTLKYMAPEQVKDAKHVDLRADIYSFGAVLYEGIAGRPPFIEEDSINLYMSVLSKDPPRLKSLRPDLPDELERVVMRCLSKDREQRYSSFEELKWVLGRCQERLREGGEGSSKIRLVK